MNKNVRKYVLNILEHDEYARQDDWYLIAMVFDKYYTRLRGVSTIYALKNAKHFHIPPAESITRARRDIQNEFPQLKAIKEIRAKEEKEYHDFYGGLK